MEERTEEPGDRTSSDWPGVGRRPLLKVLGAGAALWLGSGVASAHDDEGDNDGENQQQGFKAEVIAPHATFPDEVAAAFGVIYEDGAEEATFLHDASIVVIVKVNFEPGGSSDWHTDNGPVLVSVVEGEVDVTFEEGCVTHIYEVGEAVVISGRGTDLLKNASDSGPAMVYVIFFGVPDGEPRRIPPNRRTGEIPTTARCVGDSPLRRGRGSLATHGERG